MFDRLWGKLKGVSEGVHIEYPFDERPTKDEAKGIAKAIKVNDFTICPNRREAQRIYGFLKRHGDCDVITRSVMHKGKECIKVWRIR